VKVGVILPLGFRDDGGPVPRYSDIRGFAVAAERLGFDSIWVFDHLVYRAPGIETGGHEAWTVLSALAEATERIELGALVMCTTFRNPAVLAKMAAALDEISAGRLVLGIGCGWHDPEYEAFGFPVDHRVGRFEEALEIIVGLVRNGRVTYQGRWTSAADAVLLPPARADMPILIAAEGPRMLRLTARHADAWNWAWVGRPTEARLTAVLPALDEACREAGRDPTTLVRTVGVEVALPELGAADPDPPDPDRVLAGTVVEVGRGLAAFADAGWDHAIVSLEPSTIDGLERLAAAVEVARA
jgi:alkanesulfonate monooxygenase SsuD/methylene tetrahydromethanopterin reductase-like flavin-dependent oxidoreductase (luciferase family)